ncbi:MAG: L-threonylcarbamoyladenylate synthase [Planctomycetota bacterium]|jgi:protein-tyrosine phosphatase
METKVIKLDPNGPDTERIREAASVVDAGGLVGFPTETVYGIACRVSNSSLGRLGKVKGREPQKHYTLHIGDKDDVRRYVPTMGIRAEKVIRHAWPGPLTVVFELNKADVDKQRGSLGEEVFENLCGDGSIGIRCPANVIASTLLGEVQSPVVAPSANLAGQSPAVKAEQVLSQFSGQVDLLLDGGPCRYGRSSTVVKMGKGGLEILREGVYSQAALEEISRVSFLFVCTGNTCRSPMAEGAFSKYLAEKLGCTVDELERMGYKVGSAGVMEMAGCPASAEAVAACAAKGIDIRAHVSRALSEQLLAESDYIFAMCRMHQERIVALRPEAATKCRLLAEGEDIADPIGQPQVVYERCADLIERAVKRRISELEL